MNSNVGDQGRDTPLTTRSPSAVHRAGPGFPRPSLLSFLLLSPSFISSSSSLFSSSRPPQFSLLISMSFVKNVIGPELVNVHAALCNFHVIRASTGPKHEERRILRNDFGVFEHFEFLAGYDDIVDAQAWASCETCLRINCMFTQRHTMSMPLFH